ncbi:MAG: S8 family serine peptidase, partial [Phycisphaerales bacterium]
DVNGHGTSVCGIVNSGIIGTSRYVGAAPNAELLVANRVDNDYTVYIPWARTNGADVMLYEFGGWVQEFLDGSSNLEVAIDAEAALGIVQVVPAGNLGGSDKHAQDDVAAGGSTNFTFNVPALVTAIDWVYITALWRTTGNDVDFAVTTPGMLGVTVNLPAAPGDTNWHSIVAADGHTIWYRREDSSRGTAKYDITIERATVGLGAWTLEVINNHATDDEHVDLYIADDQTSWAGGAVWTAFQSEDNTVTRPATADSAITVASYSTRGIDVLAGDLSIFSPTGPRVDGQAIMDIAAPGNHDIASTISKDMDRDGIAGPDFPLGSYRLFGGTSAAGPHVAAASALLLQWDSTLTHVQIKTMLQQSARTDGFTGVTPNDEWGHGKLDVLAAVNEPPVCDANGPYAADCAGVTTMIALDGTGSFDPNAGDVLTYSWITDCPGGTFDDPTSPTPTLSVDCSSTSCPNCSVSLTMTDLAGASDSCSTQVEINDNVPPNITCPAGVTVECDETTDPSSTGEATATDNCDPDPVIGSSDVETPGDCPQEKTIARTWTATDTCGNSSSCVQTIEVVDTTPPDITCPADVTVTCGESTNPADTGTASAADNCDPAPVVGYSDAETYPTCPADPVMYTITRTWMATDECGNAQSCDQTITVLKLVLDLDIKPGSCPNSFNRNSHGVLPVGLLGTADFNPTMVVPGSVRLSRVDCVGGTANPHEGPPGPHTVVSDVGTPFTGDPCACHELTGDGIDDLSMKFKTDDVVPGLQLDSLNAGALVELAVTGTLADGCAFIARDCVRLVPPGTPPGLVAVQADVGGAWINAHPLDLQLDGGGFADFERTYPLGTVVTATAEQTHEGRRFVGWRLDGEFRSTEVSTDFTLVTDQQTLKAVLRWPGDMNGDDDVDMFDFATFVACYGCSAPNPPQCNRQDLACCDLDGSGTVDLADFATFAAWYGLQTTQTGPD